MIATLLPCMDNWAWKASLGCEPYHTLPQHAQSSPMPPCRWSSVSCCQLHPPPFPSPLSPPPLPCHRYPRPVWQLQHPHRQHDPAAVNLCPTRQRHGQWNLGAHGGSNVAHGPTGPCQRHRRTETSSQGTQQCRQLCSGGTAPLGGCSSSAAAVSSVLRVCGMGSANDKKVARGFVLSSAGH